MPRALNLQLVTARRLTPLLEHLAQAMREAPLPPRENDIIVVQSQGMRRWLTLELADAFGAVASMAMPFPAGFIHELARRLDIATVSRDEVDAFSRDALAWRIESLLRRLPDDAVYAPLITYLRGSDDRARFGLAERIAARFDDYQLYRADVLAGWEIGSPGDVTPHAAWQAALWRTLVADAKHAVPAAGRRLRQLIDRLQHDTPTGLPSRVTVFGVSTLPPLFVDALAALATHIPVTVLSASLTAHDPHPLATAFGAQGHEFVEALRLRGARVTALPDTAPRSGTFLHTLQAELAAGDAGTDPLSFQAHDASLRVHSAHGNLRQVEILRDQLLAALADDPTLRPHDLLLLVPDAGEWALWIDAVFGASDPAVPRIPYRIADRPTHGDDAAAAAFLLLLALPDGRLTHSEVFELLAYPLVHDAAGLSEARVDALASLTHRANARWGYDAASRSAMGLPAYEEATWRATLDRLLIGVTTGPHDDLVLGVLPHIGDTVGDVAAVARLATWIDALAETLSGWSEPRTLDRWVDAMQEGVDTVFGSPETRDPQAVASVTELLGNLRELALTSAYDGNVPFGVVRDWMETALDGDGFGTGFLAGGLTVAALKPMRSLPFRVIAVAGLDDGVFPRRERRAAFDLLEAEHRPGDRDLRSDDRQLFLDLILAAGDRLILAYSGRAVSDNSPSAASVVVDELLDHLDRRSDGAARRALLVEHPLQPFSRAYFDAARDPRLFTFASAHAMAARAAQTDGLSDFPFVTTPIEGLGEQLRAEAFDLSLADLVACWCNPSQYFCRHTLGFTIAEGSDESSDDELLMPDRMEQGAVRARMLGSSLAGADDPARDLRQYQGDGSLPPGALGAAWGARLRASVDAALAGIPATEPGRTLSLQVHGADWRVSGVLDGIRGATRYVVRAGPFQPTHELRAWIEHIAMCAACESAADGAVIPKRTVLVGVENDVAKIVATFETVAAATGHLDAIVRAARAGREMPMVFFPKAANAWLGAQLTNAMPATRAATKDPVAEAYEKFHHDGGWSGIPGDHADPHIALCFRGGDPVAEQWPEFERLLGIVFGARLHGLAGT